MIGTDTTSDTFMKNAMRKNKTTGKTVQAFLRDPRRSSAAWETHLVGNPGLPGALRGQTNGFAFSEMHFWFIITNVTSLLFYAYSNSIQLLFARTFPIFSVVSSVGLSLKRRTVGALLLLKF